MTQDDTDDLHQFVRAAMAQGAEPSALRAVLTDAGWPEVSTDAALARWQRSPGLPPVPRPAAAVETPRLAGQRRRVTLMQVALLMTLAFLCWHVIWLGFGVIDAMWPATPSPWIARDSLRWSVAAVLVALGIVWVLTFRLRRMAARLRIGRVVAGGALLLSSATLMGAGVTTLYRLLSGDLTLAFGAKTLLVVVLAGLVAGLYRDDLA